jgi:hypothetical protein
MEGEHQWVRQSFTTAALRCEMDRRLGRPVCWARITFPSRRSARLFHNTGEPGNATVRYHRDKLAYKFVAGNLRSPGVCPLHWVDPAAS